MWQNGLQTQFGILLLLNLFLGEIETDIKMSFLDISAYDDTSE